MSDIWVFILMVIIGFIAAGYNYIAKTLGGDKVFDPIEFALYLLTGIIIGLYAWISGMTIEMMSPAWIDTTINVFITAGVMTMFEKFVKSILMYAGFIVQEQPALLQWKGPGGRG